MSKVSLLHPSANGSTPNGHHAPSSPAARVVSPLGQRVDQLCELRALLRQAGAAERELTQEIVRALEGAGVLRFEGAAAVARIDQRTTLTPDVGLFLEAVGTRGYAALTVSRTRRFDTEEAARDWLRENAPPPPDAGWFFVNASPTHGHRINRAGLPLLTRSIFYIVRTRVSPIIDRPAHPHLLRHSFATRLRENGAGIELIQEAMGHADIRTTTVYAHISTSKRREELTRFLEGRPDDTGGSGPRRKGEGT